MTVNIVEILDLYLKNGGRRPYIIIVLNSCFIPKMFRTFPGFLPIFHRYNKNQDFFRTGNGFYEIPDFFPFSRLRGNPAKPRGSIIDLGDDSKRLSRKAYPGMPKHLREELAIGHFLDSLNDHSLNSESLKW